MRKLLSRTCLLLSFLLLVSSVMAQRMATRRTTHRATTLVKTNDNLEDQQFTEIGTRNINTEKCDGYPWISADGLRLYFTSNRDGGHGNLYLAERSSTDADFPKPVKLFPKLENKYYAAALSPDELTMILTLEGYTIYITERKTRTEKFSDPKPVAELKDRRLYAPSISPDGKELIAIESATNETVYFEKDAAGHFIKKGKLNIPEHYSSAPGQFSKDGLTYYCSLKSPSGESDKLHYFTRPNKASAFIYAGPMPSLGNISNYIQPSVNSDGTLVAYVKNEDHLWDSNNIRVTKLGDPLNKELQVLPALVKMLMPQVEKVQAISYQPNLASVEIKAEADYIDIAPYLVKSEVPVANPIPATASSTTLSPVNTSAAIVYPNPFTNHFSVVYNGSFSGKMILEIFDATGSRVFSKEIIGKTTQIKDVNLPAGKYLYRISSSKGVNYSGTLIALK